MYFIRIFLFNETENEGNLMHRLNSYILNNIDKMEKIISKHVRRNRDSYAFIVWNDYRRTHVLVEDGDMKLITYNMANGRKRKLHMVQKLTRSMSRVDCVIKILYSLLGLLPKHAFKYAAKEIYYDDFITKTPSLIKGLFH
jgi:glutamate formiminotransferase